MQHVRPHRLKRSVSHVLRVMACGVIVVLCFAALDARLRPIVTTMAQYQCRSAAVRAINEAVQEVLVNQQDLYDRLIDLSYGQDGAVSSLTVNTVAENEFKALLTEKVSARLQALGKQPVAIPLGTLMGWQLMAGRGPDITLRFLPASMVHSNTTYTFESTGINQTHHRIYIEFTVEMSAILPGYSTSVTVKTQICMAQTLIVGRVPQFYAEGNTV